MSQSSTPDNGESYTEYSLKCCRKEELEGIRHHLIKFQSRNKVDPVAQFDAPVRLHRKDPRNLQFQLTRKEIEERKRERDAKIKKLQMRQLQRRLDRHETNYDLMDLDEDIAEGDSDLDEVLKQIRAEEERKRFKLQGSKPSTDLTVVAPDGGARNQKRNMFKKKTRQVNIVDENKRKLRYEEYYPWVMEDYDGKNTWVGSYEAGSSDSYVVFVFDNDGFKMIPLEKVYKFTPRNKYATLTLEEAESRMQKNSLVPRWLMKHMADEDKANTVLDPRFRKTQNNKLKTVSGSSSLDLKGSDNEDIDFDDEFADDEEAPIIEDEEQNRDSERRMKREMLSANALGIEREYEDEDDDDEEFADLFGSKKLEDKDVKKLRKTLVKSEMNDAYDTDDDENPYISNSEDEDNEEKVKKEEQDDKIPIKQESNDQIPRRSQSPSVPRQIVVTSIKNQIIKIKAPTLTLKLFPVGEWNPNLVKRVIETSEPPAKKIKLETNDSIPREDDILTEEDIKKAVQNGPIKIADLLSGLKRKIHRHPENKSRVKMLVKKCLKQQNGLLYLKENV